MTLGYGNSQKFGGSPLIFLQLLRLATSNFACKWGLPRRIIKSHREEKSMRVCDRGTPPNLVGIILVFLQRLKFATSHLACCWVCEGPSYKSHADVKVSVILNKGTFPKFGGSPISIYTMAEASDFKFITQLWFAKKHNKITPRGENGLDVTLG